MKKLLSLLALTLALPSFGADGVSVRSKDGNATNLTVRAGSLTGVNASGATNINGANIVADTINSNKLDVPTRALLGGGGTATTYTNRFIYVDWTYGNNTNGVRGRADKPFKSCYDIHNISSGSGVYAGATTVAQSGDTIVMNPGVHYDPVIPLPDNVNLYLSPGAVLIRANFSNANNFAYATLTTCGPLVQPGNNSIIDLFSGTCIATNNAGDGYDATLGWLEGLVTRGFLEDYGFDQVSKTNVTVYAGNMLGTSDNIYFIQTNTAARDVTFYGGRLRSGWDCIRADGNMTLKTLYMDAFSTNTASATQSRGVVVSSGVKWSDTSSSIGAGGGTTTNNNAVFALGTGTVVTFRNTSLYNTGTNGTALNLVPPAIAVGSYNSSNNFVVLPGGSFIGAFNGSGGGLTNVSGSQTPWTGTINGAANILTNVNNIYQTNQAGLYQQGKMSLSATSYKTVALLFDLGDPLTNNYFSMTYGCISNTFQNTATLDDNYDWGFNWGINTPSSPKYNGDKATLGYGFELDYTTGGNVRQAEHYMNFSGNITNTHERPWGWSLQYDNTANTTYVYHSWNVEEWDYLAKNMKGITGVREDGGINLRFHGNSEISFYSPDQPHTNVVFVRDPLGGALIGKLNNGTYLGYGDVQIEGDIELKAGKKFSFNGFGSTPDFYDGLWSTSQHSYYLGYYGHHFKTDHSGTGDGIERFAIYGADTVGPSRVVSFVPFYQTNSTGYVLLTADSAFGSNRLTGKYWAITNANYYSNGIAITGGGGGSGITLPFVTTNTVLFTNASSATESDFSIGTNGAGNTALTWRLGSTYNTLYITPAGLLYSGGSPFTIADGGIYVTGGSLFNNDVNVTTTVTAGALVVGGGPTISKILSATSSLDFGSTLAAANSDLTITVTGAAVNDAVSLGLPAAPNASCTFEGFVSAADTVTVRCHNVGAITVDPASATYRATVIHY